MNYKQYPPSIWTRLENAIENATKQMAAPVAAFDADGTLWDADLGEGFFQYLIDHRKVSLPADPWAHYLELKKKNGDPREAYLWLAQILEGQKIDTVRQWAKEAVERNPLPLFPEQKLLIDRLRAQGIRVFVVTASVKWAVEPGAKVLGLEYDDVIGVETEVENYVVTKQQKGPITYKAGKVDALLLKTGGQPPFLASGNTMGDFALLESATLEKLAVSAAAENEKLLLTENELRDHALQKGWMTHRFVDVGAIRSTDIREET